MSDSPPPQPESITLVIDRLARAVFTWVRHEVMQQRFSGVNVLPAEELALAAGFIAGLRTRIDLAGSEATLLAYAYALMSGERKGALELADKLLVTETARSFSCSGYLHGLQAARDMLTGIQGNRISVSSHRPKVNPDFSIQ